MFTGEDAMADKDIVQMPAGIDVDDDELFKELVGRNGDAAEVTQETRGDATIQPPRTASRPVIH